MVEDRRVVKDWLHDMRDEVIKGSDCQDPFAAFETQDDVDLTLFAKMITVGPSSTSLTRGGSEEATVCDYAFWWIRILNGHFAITDLCGHYPYWIRHFGEELSEHDRHYLRVNDAFRTPAEEEGAMVTI
jgi:hypothetical protein